MNTVALTSQGEGPAIVLIHGFPMHGAIWKKFIPPLLRSFRVHVVDLPGFGDSPALGRPFGLEDVAAAVLRSLDAAGVDRAVVVGHSLGGYVALAMAARRPELLTGLVLFHSTAEPDNPEKKANRDKVIAFIQQHGAEAFTGNFSANVFADPLHPDVPFVREMNMATPADVLVDYTAAMRDRPDRKPVLRSLEAPVMFIAGSRDQAIPESSIREQARLCRNPSVHILADQNHMALLEDVTTTSSLVYDFATRCN